MTTSPEPIKTLIGMLAAIGSWRAAQAERDPADLKALTASVALGNIARGIERDIDTPTLLQACDVLAKPDGLARAYLAAVEIGSGPDVPRDAEAFVSKLIATRAVPV